MLPFEHGYNDDEDETGGDWYTQSLVMCQNPYCLQHVQFARPEWLNYFVCGYCGLEQSVMEVISFANPGQPLTVIGDFDVMDEE